MAIVPALCAGSAALSREGRRENAGRPGGLPHDEEGGIVVEFGSRFFVGLDLGQARDHTAMAVVERRVERGARNLVSYEWERVVTLRLRMLERMELGVSYPAVVGRVRAFLGQPEIRGNWELMVDATGVGRPVVDLLRTEGLGRRLWPVTITGGETDGYHGGYYRVPKRDLVVGLQVAMQRGELQIAAKMRECEVLLREMREMQVRVSGSGREQFGVWRDGEHDDLVLAVALAMWGSRQGFPLCGEGTRRLL